MVFFVLVVSFAAIDWVMTLDPHWFSTIWGLLFVAGWALSFFCFRCDSGRAVRQRADESHSRQTTFSRCRQIDARARDGLGVFQFFAISDYLVGKFAGRNALVFEPNGRTAGASIGIAADCFSLRVSVSRSAFARCQTQREMAGADGGFYSCFARSSICFT
jgi:hypothetical protein